MRVGSRLRLSRCKSDQDRLAQGCRRPCFGSGYIRSATDWPPTGRLRFDVGRGPSDREQGRLRKVSAGEEPDSLAIAPAVVGVADYCWRSAQRCKPRPARCIPKACMAGLNAANLRIRYALITEYWPLPIPMLQTFGRCPARGDRCGRCSTPQWKRSLSPTKRQTRKRPQRRQPP